MKDSPLEAVYVKSINGTDDIIKDNKPKVTFLGRSNVGKISLINSLVGKQLARSSSRPGKTVKLDFFLVEHRIFLSIFPDTDLPNGVKMRWNITANLSHGICSGQK